MCQKSVVLYLYHSVVSFFNLAHNNTIYAPKNRKHHPFNNTKCAAFKRLAYGAF